MVKKDIAALDSCQLSGPHWILITFLRKECLKEGMLEGI